MQEKIKILTENIILELAPQKELWEVKKILSLLKKPKGEERLAFWQENLEIDRELLPGKTALQKDKSLVSEIEKNFVPCLENLIEQKKIYMLYDINSKNQKIKKYTLSFPMESYHRDTETFLKTLQEEKKQKLEQLAQKEAEILTNNEKEKKKIAQEKEKELQDIEEKRQILAQEQEKFKQKQEEEILRQEQIQKEQKWLLQQIQEHAKRIQQAGEEYKNISEQNKKVAQNMGETSQGLIKQIQALFPQGEKKTKTSLPKPPKEKKAQKPGKKKNPSPKSEKALSKVPSKIEKPIFPEEETDLEIVLEDVCEKIRRLYCNMRLIQNYPVIKIHLIRRELHLPREIFNQAIEKLAREKKVDLLQASTEEDFESDERRDAYYDAIEDRKYYFIQWRQDKKDEHSFGKKMQNPGPKKRQSLFSRSCSRPLGKRIS